MIDLNINGESRENCRGNLGVDIDFPKMVVKNWFVQSAPIKILDATNLQDDFYIDTLDWS